MVMRPVWISVYGCLAPAFLRFGGGGYYHYPVLGTEPAAVLKARGEGWTAFLSVREISHFLQLLDITPRMVEPVMTHQYRLRFAHGSAAEKALAALRQLELGEETVFGARLTGADIHFGCQIYDRLEGNGEIDGVPGRNEPLYFFDLLYAIDAAKSARHHPEGVLWVHTREHAIHSEPVSILDIAPTIFDLMGVRNTIAEASARGVSLVPRFRSSSQAEEKQVA